MPEYKVTRISEQPPREWAGPHGTVYYLKVMLEGHSRPVSIGKKKPDALKVGDTVYGTIEDSDLPEDKFKAEQRPQGSFGGSASAPKSSYQRDDNTQESIARSVALKAAVDSLSYLKDTSPVRDRVLSLADDYLAWLQGGDKPVDSVEKKEPVRPFDKLGKPKDDDDAAVEAYKASFEEEPIDLDQIPF